MVCKKCGNNNTEGNKFCIKCGNSLVNTVPSQIPNDNQMNRPQNMNQMPNNNQMNRPQNMNQMPNVQNQNFNRNNVATSHQGMNIFKYMLGILIKPFETYKNNENKLSSAKTSLILSSIVAGAMMLISLFTAMISATFVKKLDYSTFKYKTVFEIEGLKDLNYLSLIVKNLFIYLGIIAAIAVVYYLATLVAKKSINFLKTVTITASAMLPFVVMGMVVSPILGKIWFPLTIISIIIGIAYSVIIFILLINDNVKFDKRDYTAYFHLACITILGASGYFAVIKILTSGLTNGLENYLDIFN